MLVTKRKKAFTLIELIVVMAIIVIVVGISFTSLTRSQSQQVFNNNFDKIVSIFSNARSLAITGKGQLDYTDFDNDGCNNTVVKQGATCTAPDYVIPAGYAVNFDSVAKKVLLFADMNPPLGQPAGKRGSYNSGTAYTTGDDLILDTLTLPSNLSLEVPEVSIGKTQGSIFFSPNYADVSFENLVPNPFIIIRLRGTKPDRCRQIKVHKLAGVPEIDFCPLTNA